MTYFETRKKKKALSVKVLLQLPVRRCITRSGAPACARRGREPAPGSAVPCPSLNRLPPPPPPGQRARTGRGITPEAGPSGEGARPAERSHAGVPPDGPGTGPGTGRSPARRGRRELPGSGHRGGRRCRAGISLETHVNVGTPGFARGGGVKPSLMRGWLFG